MKRLFSMDSPVMVFLAHVGNLLLLNAMWLVACLPIVTIGASTTAMYRVLLKQLDGSDDRVWTAFFRALRSNFKKATAIFLILLIPTAILAGDCWILISGVLQSNPGLLAAVQVFTLLPAAALLLVSTYVYPLTAVFENTVGGTLKNAAMLSIAHLPLSVVMAALNILPLLLMLFAPEVFILSLFILLVAGGALIALANSAILRRIFRRYLPAPEPQP